MSTQEHIISDKKQKKVTNSCPKSILIFTLAGLLAGAVITGPAMSKINERRLSFDETVAVIENSVMEHVWASSGTIDMNKEMSKHGVEFSPRESLNKVCDVKYAKCILTTGKHIACTIPCSMPVGGGDDGTVSISTLNLRLRY
ncbi:MAG: DUF302 domain-containing protein [Deltaproteobacteria bacterium]|nr:DUF302 domain-containing protein [Deltaproteobacteria bacterium]